MKRLATLISGNGTTAEAVLKAIQNKTLTGLNPIVISSNKEAKGNTRVKNLRVELHILDKNSFKTRKEFDTKLLHLLEKLQIDIISLQGWLPLISQEIVKKYQGQIINQHPGPLDPGRPDFGGSGMSTPYRTNCTRLAYIWATGEDAWTENDTHFVTEKFDEGEIIRVEKMAIPKKNKKVSIESLQNNPEELIQTTHDVQKVFYPVEHHNVIKTLEMFSKNKVKIFKRDKPLIPDEYVQTLEEAKKLATSLFPNYNL